MRKEDLQNGMIVETNGAVRYLVLNKYLLSEAVYCDFHSLALKNFNKNLVWIHGEECNIQHSNTIVKVYKSKALNIEKLFKTSYLELVWKRPEKKNFSKIELNVLKSIHPKWKWLVRDDDGDMILYKNEPIYNHGWHSSNSDLYDYDDECFGGFDHLFECISRDDREPLYIDDYVKREEID